MRPAIGLPMAMSAPAPSRAQQPGQARLQHHEQARAASRAPAPQAPRCRSAIDDRARTLPPRWLAHRRPRPVGRQLDLIRQVLQRAVQNDKLPRDRALGIALVAQRRLLPQRVVGVLHRQRRQLRRHAPRTAPGRTPPGPATTDPATSRRRRCDAAAARSTCSSAPSSNRCARSGSSPPDRSPAPAQPPSAAGKARLHRPAAISSRGRASPAPGSTAAAPRAAPGTACAGSRAARPDRTARLSSAARSSAPVSRTASGIT